MSESTNENTEEQPIVNSILNTSRSINISLTKD